jgi:hypothetical protein
MPKILHCDNVKNGIELTSSIEGGVVCFEEKSGAKDNRRGIDPAGKSKPV